MESIDEDSDVFHLKVKQNTFGDLLEQYRKDEEFTDVKLKIGDKLFPAHRVILSLQSPVLKAMISEQWSKEGICEIGDEYLDEEIMEGLLNFLYTGSVDLTLENVHSFCVAAHFLQISILLEASEKQLSKLVTADNVFSLFLFSNSCQLEMLKKSCSRFFQIHHEKVFQDPKILDLSIEDFKGFIEGLKKETKDSVHLKRKFKEDTFHCIVRWIEWNWINDSSNVNSVDCLPFLLENIPIEELSFEFLTQTVSTHYLVKDSLSCAQILIKAFGKRQTNQSSNRMNQESKNKQNLIILGGQTDREFPTASMLYYCSETGVWSELLKMEQARSNFSAIVTSDQRKIVVCGGYIDDLERTTDKVEMFDWNTKTWSELPKMPIRLGSSSSSMYHNDLYVAGGKVDRQNSSKDVLWYNSKTNNWEYLHTTVSTIHYPKCLGQGYMFWEEKEVKSHESMNTARSDNHMIEYKNCLYAIGGGTNTVERYDRVLDKWTKMANMKNHHQYFGATLHQGKIYVCGNEGFEVYDPDRNVWTSLPAPILGLGTSLVSLNGKLLAVGGRFANSSEVSDSMYEFNFSTQKWIEFGKLPTKLVFHCSLVGDFN